MTRDKILERLAGTRREIDEMLDAMTLDDLTAPGVAGDWSVRDMLLHLAWYLSEEAGLIAEDPSYEPSPFWAHPQDERNDVIRDHFRSQDVQAARDALAEGFGRLVDAVGRLSDEDLVTPGRFPGTSEERLPWMDIADNSFAHEQEHIEMIREWLHGRPRKAASPRSST